MKSAGPRTGKEMDSTTCSRMIIGHSSDSVPGKVGGKRCVLWIVIVCCVTGMLGCIIESACLALEWLSTKSPQ